MSAIYHDGQRLFNPKDVALQLGIKRQTVTKYARELEEAGMIFHKNERNDRLYTDENIIMFRELMNLKEKKGHTLNSAAKIVASAPKPPKEDSEPLEGKLDTLTAIVEEQGRMISRLGELIDFQSQVIKELRTDFHDQARQMNRSLQEHEEEVLERLEVCTEKITAACADKQKKSFLSTFKK